MVRRGKPTTTKAPAGRAPAASPSVSPAQAPSAGTRAAQASSRLGRAGFSSRAVHGGDAPDPLTGSIATPLHLTSTYWYPELPPAAADDGAGPTATGTTGAAIGAPAPYVYSRHANPTVEAAEAKAALLEAAAGALLTGSGMAATTAVCVATLKAGDVLAVQPGVYGGTTSLFSQELARFGVKVHGLPSHAPPKLPAGTRLVWMESITNPLLRVADVAAWARAAHEAGALLAVDASFASPAVQRPLELGADLVMHSATKFLGGHSDLIAGLVAWRDPALRDDLWRVRRNLGPTLDPHAAYLLARGMKTLAVRMERHCRNALELARACSESAAIEAVHYPGLASHPDHAVARRVLQDGFGGVVTIDLGSKARAIAFRRNLRLVIPASSLGGVESLASLPVETSHSYATAAERRALGIGDGLVRIAVGIEDASDIVEDVLQAAIRRS